MKDRLAKSVFWVVWSRGVLQVISFVSTLVVVRLLSPEDFGLMALAGIWTSGIALISEMGLGAAIVQFRDLEESEMNACFWLTNALAGLGYLALYLLAPAIAAWFASPRLTRILRVVGLILPLLAIRVVPDSLLRKRLDLDKVAQAEVISAMVNIPVMLSMAWAGAGVWALVAGALVAPLVQGMVIVWFVQWWPGLQVRGRRLRELLHFSLATFGARACWAVYEQADSFILGKVSGTLVLGFYSIAKQVALLPVEKVAAVVNQLASPVMAELQADPGAMRATLLRCLRLVAWVTFPLCIGLAVVAKDLVWLALTDKWTSAIPIIRVLCVYAMIRSMAVLLPPVLMARYRAKFLFGYNAALLVAMPLTFWVGAVWSGALGVAAAWLIVYPIIMARMAWEVLYETRTLWRTLWTALWPPAAAALVMLIVMLLVQSGLSSWTGDLVAARLVILSLAGAAAYGAGLLRVGGPVRAEMLEVAGWLLRRSRPLAAAE
jgi:O-antigen/teichoic acid export membrane protein